jgi:uncharacterized protein
MKKLLFLFLFLVSCANQACFNDACYSLEIADNPLSRAQGLMHRDFLPADSGMLFIFQKPGTYTFWMKNTLIPLDIIWLNKEFEVIFINKNTPPCTANPCPSYGPREPASYVLELNSGEADKIDLAKGDTITLSLR